MKRFLTAIVKPKRKRERYSRVRFIPYILSFIFFLSSFFFHPSSFANAQGVAYAEIGVPDASAFPTITISLDVYDSSGQFVAGLKPSDVAAIEDGNPRPVQQLTEETVGVQIVIGVNPGPALDMRDSEGITRYQRVQQMVGGWAMARPLEANDNLSLVTVAGPLIAHTTPEAWLASFAAFQPNFRATTPNIQSLALSLDAAITPTSQAGMKRAILFITPHMEDPNLEAAIKTIGERAVAAHTRITVWLVDGEQYFGHPSALLFQSLAAQTGGGYLAFSGRESLPDPENYFSPLRRVYHLTYASALNASGEHSLSVDVSRDGLAISSPPQAFSINVQVPNPILAALPAQVTRGAPHDDPYNTEVLIPDELPLEVVFDFPDGHPRPIVHAALYVDGELAAEKASAPFENFVWDISGYTVSGQHELRVEATDSLGLTGSSLGLPVTVTVIKPPSGLSTFLARYRLFIVWGVVAVAGLSLVGVLFGSLIRRARRQRKTKRREYADPLTQPIAIAAVEPPTGKKKALRRKKMDKTADAPAWLTRLNPDGEPANGNPIPLTTPELTLGTDPTQSASILDEPSISPIHARIQQAGTGYILFDQNSVAGTWVNYEPVPREGHPLKHGDKVHFGRLVYRFALKQPPAIPEPTITLTDS